MKRIKTTKKERVMRIKRRVKGRKKKKKFDGGSFDAAPAVFDFDPDSVEAAARLSLRDQTAAPSGAAPSGTSTTVLERDVEPPGAPPRARAPARLPGGRIMGHLMRAAMMMALICSTAASSATSFACAVGELVVRDNIGNPCLKGTRGYTPSCQKVGFEMGFEEIRFRCPDPGLPI